MLNNPITYVLISGICFGFWPIVARTANSTSTNTSLVVSTVTFLLLISFMLIKKQTGELLSADTGGILRLSIAGLINGIGIIAYGLVVNWQGEGVELSKLVPASVGIMIAAAFISSTIIFKEPVTASKLIGIGMLVGGIYFLNK